MKKEILFKDRKLREYLIEQKNLLENVVVQKQTEIEKAPGGTLKIIQKNHTFQFYIRYSGDKQAKYLKKSNDALIKAHLQKKYNIKILKISKKALKSIDAFLQSYPFCEIEDMHSKLLPYIKERINPILSTDEDYASSWLNVEYEKKTFGENVPEFYTDRGERVRSKSEVLIANMLVKLGIPYRYEFPLTLRGGVLIHPDFMILDVKNRREFYWEHLGMMDDREYVRNALSRISDYKKNDIFPGKNLIITFETYNNPIQMREVEREIKAIMNI